MVASISMVRCVRPRSGHEEYVATQPARDERPPTGGKYGRFRTPSWLQQRCHETATACHEWNGVREKHASGHPDDDDQDWHGDNRKDPVPVVLSVCQELDHSQAYQRRQHDQSRIC